ncbi:acetylcholinesterase-1, partial [Caerostris darwini]
MRHLYKHHLESLRSQKSKFSLSIYCVLCYLCPPFSKYVQIRILFINFNWNRLVAGKLCKCDPIIRIGKKHQIIGQSVLFMNTEINEYLGIPYAKPPIGDLRFKKTKPLRPCPEVVNAKRLPPACPQYSEDPYPWYVNSSYQSEDCLYLNIWTPADASPENRKAVMYWIHGGAYKYGSISELYSGVPLAAFGNIIVVTVNYRLGPLGFLSLGTKDAPGNAGLWDVLEGLRWVNRNIVYFGGDELRITIAGESVGSSMVGFLAVSPLAKGLFARQIMQSGSPAEPTSTNSTRNILLAQKLAETVGCAGDNSTVQDDPEDVIQCLKDVDSDTLIEASYRLDPLSQLDFVPQQGDKLLPVNPSSAIFEGSFRCRQLLIGVTKDEGSRM